ncbi:MAG: hypothetical protein FWD23_09460, partial [Oscillospiraceae bacterium]|nr:hypothetical protein [Oscillospiraceae bacterium]
DIYMRVGVGNFDMRFERELINKNKDDRIEFTLTIPDSEKDKYNYDKVKYSVVVKSIYEVVIPELNDEFVKEQYGAVGLKNLGDYYEYMRKNYKAERLLQIKMNTLNEIYNTIIDNSMLYVNKNLMDIENSNQFKFDKQFAQSLNMTVDEYITEILDITSDEYYNKIEDDYYKTLQMQLIVNTIAKKEKILITDQEIEEMLKYLYGEDEITYTVKRNEVIYLTKKQKVDDYLLAIS